MPKQTETAPANPGKSLSTIALSTIQNETLVVAVTVVASLCAVAAMAIFIRFDEWGLNLFRIFIITSFTMLPAVMYYVFTSSRKRSLFQEFVSNLSRLGLLQRQREDDLQSGSDSGRYYDRTRILSYIDRFEAVYGPVDKQSKATLLDATDCSVTTDQQRSRVEPPGGRIFSPATAIPVFVATFLIGLGWIQFIRPWTDEQPMANLNNATLHAALLYNELPALFAFLGAYFFSLQMLYRRYVTNDLRASAFISISIRIILGVIGAWLLQILFKTGMIDFENETYWLLFASFVVGVFPPVLWRIIRDVSGRLLIFSQIVPSLDSDLPLSELDGLTIWHQTRLEEEDIENAYNMANADIIALLVNTKMPPERIIDWVDQAILYTCIRPQHSGAGADENNIRARLWRMGIGNATALKSVVRLTDPLKSKDDPPDASNRIDWQGISVQSLIQSVNGFNNLALIDHWRTQRPRDEGVESHAFKPNRLAIDVPQANGRTESADV